jgi:hypothetical protein
MAQALLSEDLWSLVAAHLPAHRKSPKGGRPRLNDRATLTGILFVLKTGIPESPRLSWTLLSHNVGDKLDSLPEQPGATSAFTCGLLCE